MSLDYKPLGNPNWKKGFTANPKGRPKGPTKQSLDVKRRVLLKFRTHPIDKLIKIANFLEASNPEMAAKIWMRILDSCEIEERKKKDSLPPLTTEEKTLTESDALKILEEIENGQNQIVAPSDSNGMATGETPIQAEASSTQDLPGYKEE